MINEETNNLNFQLCFPTTIMRTYNVAAAEELLPIAKKYLASSSGSETNTLKYGYKTTYGGEGLQKYEDMKLFSDYVSELGKHFMLNCGYSESNFPNGLKSHIFASEMYAGNYHGPHTHPNCLLSGIFYLQVPEGSSSIVFSDPRPKSKFLNLQIDRDTESNLTTFAIKPKKGMLLMWESWLEHEVPRTRNTEDGRITLVFNLNPK